MEVVSYCLEVGLIRQPVMEADLAELRRVRRLQTLEVNLLGIEIILQMRRRMMGLQSEIVRLQSQIITIQNQLE